MIKALVVGINRYKDFPLDALRGCVNDANDMRGWLTDPRRVPPPTVTTLCDEQATKSAIDSALNDMIASASAGDHLLFYFSGHGSQILSKSEDDYLDEVLCPHDFKYNGEFAILDDDIARWLETLPAGVSMTVVADACCSGDIKQLSPMGRPKSIEPQRGCTGSKFRRRLFGSVAAAGFGAAVSACASYEDADDTCFDGRPNGAFTHYWLEALGETPLATLDQLVAAVAVPLKWHDMQPQVDGTPELCQAPFLNQPMMAVPGKEVSSGVVSAAAGARVSLGS
jgi:metacaspase-1